ncbi:MAG: plastocyanin/azurin family copper-binding protein [Acidimicrobiia bacterium]
MPHPHRPSVREAWLAPWAGLVVVLLAVMVALAACDAGAPLAAGTDDLPGGEASSIGLAADVVVPAFTPKADLSVDDRVAVSVAPEVPAAPDRDTQAIVEVTFEVVEGVFAIDPASGLEYETWGYRVPGSGDVIGTPGPLIRARVGDVLRFTIVNPEGNTHPHNVDFHAVTGDHGGAGKTTVAPGETATIEARLLYPGMFMYHCAYGDVPSHIAHGMYGGILVDPAEPLAEVDREWYVVQSEYYLTSTDPGLAETDRQAVTDEDPSLVVFNGAVGAIAGDNALQMAVGERARIYFVNAGLNLIASFHPIGSHWDRVYPEAALLNPPIRGSQTTLVPAGGGTVVEMVGQYPGSVVLVDHALTRTFDKGALGQVMISGEEDPEIYEAVAPDSDGDQPEGEGTPDETTSTTEAADGEGGAATGETVDVAILAGSGDFQDVDAPDEFAEVEDPADYSVNVLTVNAGTTVTWTNEDGMLHTVTDVDGAFDSGFFGEGESWSYTFTEPGEFEYFCQPHPWMRARIIVEP